MNKLNVLALKFIFLSFTFFIYSCAGGSASSSFGLPSSTILPPDGVAGSSDGITDTSQFFVGVNSEINTIAHVHISGDFTKACSILPTEQSKDITCIVDIPEGDLFNAGLSLKYNVPPGMCRYLSRLPYWYYNQEVGRGPRNIEVYRELSLDGSVMSGSYASVDGVKKAVNLVFAEATVTILDSPPTVKCVYNTLGTGNSGNNCCFGDYSYTLHENKHTDPAVLSASTDSTTNPDGITANWNGSYSSCIGGAGIDWEKKNKDGVPSSILTNVKQGLINQIYTHRPPVDLNMETPNNRRIANYYISSLHTHTGFGPILPVPVAARTSSKPYFIDPIDDRSGTKFPSPDSDKDPRNYIGPTSDAYTFACLDEGFEYMHNIRVFVREWDTYQDYVNYIQSKGVIEIPDRGSGLEGVNCAGLFGDCNDFYDIDDFVTLERSGVGYTTTSADITRRNEYFPRDK